MPPTVETLLQTVGNVDQLLILTHNNPDPDALAATVAFQHLLAQKAGLTAEQNLNSFSLSQLETYFENKKRGTLK